MGFTKCDKCAYSRKGCTLSEEATTDEEDELPATTPSRASAERDASLPAKGKEVVRPVPRVANRVAEGAARESGQEVAAPLSRPSAAPDAAVLEETQPGKSYAHYLSSRALTRPG